MQDEHSQAPAMRLDGFRERAIREAQRYGQDPWIFVRELLQNARDAGATRVQFLYKESDHQSELHCVDNGEGMGWDHAQRYLFSLYTSSKEQAHNKAGRFGVGFWSILRFVPENIIIRSKPRGAPVAQGWGLSIDGHLRNAKTCSPAKQSGTQIILERPGNNAQQATQLLEAVRDHGRFLTQRDDPNRKLEILVNGVCINTPFALPEPSIAFSRKGIRGVVALAPHGKVELFSRGLRVRCAATLDDLVSSRPLSKSSVRIQGIAPQILLDCDNIQVLLHRSDVRENAELKRAMSLTRRHLRRLVQAQLSGVRPPSSMELLACAKQRFLERSKVFRWGSTCALVACIALGAWGLAPSKSKQDARIKRTLSLGAFRQHYQGPTVQQVDASSDYNIDFSYSPTNIRPHFRQFSISNLKSMRPAKELDLVPYEGSICDRDKDCITVKMQLDGKQTLLLDGKHLTNLIEATGYRIDPQTISLTWQGHTQKLGTALDQDQRGDPWLSSEQPLSGRLEYQMAAFASPEDPLARQKITDPDFLAWKPKASQSPKQAQSFVAEKVQYALDPITASAHEEAIEREQNVFWRGINIGAGDCDVQNTLLAAILRDQGYESRLALGYVGEHGQLPSVAHAWTEYRDTPSDPWSIADASVVPEPQGPAIIAQGPQATHLDFPEPLKQTSPQNPEPSPFGWWWVGFGVCLTFAGVFLSRWQKAPEGSIDKSQKKLIDLLLSALEHPSSFSDIPGVFRRAVVSTLGPRPISLTTVKHAHRYGRLWCASHKHPIAQRALACGDHLLDNHCPVAKAVSMQMQVEELDSWQRKWEARDRSHEQLNAINRIFSYLGLRVMAVTSEQIGSRPEQILFGPRPLRSQFSKERKQEVPARCLVFYSSNHELVVALKGEDPLWARYCFVQDLLGRIAVDESLAAVVQGYFAKQTCKELVA